MPENYLMNTGEPSLASRKSLTELAENHSQFADYQQCKLNSVDNQFHEDFWVISKTWPGSTKIKKSSKNMNSTFTTTPKFSHHYILYS